jgi:hypothetical protein
MCTKPGPVSPDFSSAQLRRRSDHYASRRIVRLIPVESYSPGPAPRFERRIGTAKGMLVVPDDFNDPLSDDILDEFGK